MDPGTPKNGLTILMHVVTWALLGFLLLFYPPLSWDIVVPQGFWIKQVINLFLMLGAFYFNALYMAPKFLFRNNKTVFVGWTIFSVAFIMVFARIVEIQLDVARQMSLVTHKSMKGYYLLDGYLLMVSIMTIVVSTMLAMIQRWQDDARKREKIEKQQIASELALLKAQINPHFFFNTLNNIYSLTFSDIPVSRDALLTLSRMMRYVLYDTLHDSALMSQEITFIKDYVSLMKLRLHSYTKLEFEEPKTDGEYIVAPMLVLPFIENAFKHGTSAMQEARIVIELHIFKGILQLRVMNNISHERDAYDFDRGGIGLVNTKKRLNLLYPDRHILQINENAEEKTYEVLLTINVQKKPVESIENEIELHNS